VSPKQSHGGRLAPSVEKDGLRRPFRLSRPPSSTTAIGSFSTGCADVFAAQRNRDASNAYFPSRFNFGFLVLHNVILADHHRLKSSEEAAEDVIEIVRTYLKLEPTPSRNSPSATTRRRQTSKPSGSWFLLLQSDKTHPLTFGAAEACELLALNPNQPTRHRRIISP
jgi:hypothetical protein